MKLFFNSIIFLLVLGSCDKGKSKLLNYADNVTIYRDAFGVPHVYGEDDASAAFGFAYAQAEDNFSVIEDNFIDAIGRSTEVIGEKGILDDWLNKSLEIVELSKKELKLLSPEVQEVCKGYAEGLNYYLKTHPEVQPKLITSFEPWYPLAFIRYLYYQRVLLQYYSKIPSNSFKKAYQKLNTISNTDLANLDFNNKKVTGEGSNTWAVNGKKSVSGNPLLLINPHLSFFGNAQVYEAHIMSKSGWNFSGYTRFGFPLPYVGFGENLGWSSTDNAADLVDAYIEDLSKENDVLSYKYDGKFRKASEWTESIKVKNGNSTYTKDLNFVKTHHGPIVSVQNNQYLSVKMAKYETPGWLEQWYLMTKAKDLKEFKKATSRLDVQFGNYLYADKEGNIHYVYNGAIPIRSAKYDWSKPVDGSISDTEWQGYHTIDEIPQVMNPSSGWIQNCNGTPFLSTLNDNPNTENFPNYMVPDRDNNRSEQSRKILSETESFSFESFIKKSHSSYILSAEKELPSLFKEWEETKEKNKDLRKPIEVLKNWNYESTISSIATTIYIHWSEKKQLLKRQSQNIKYINTFALNEVLKDLINKWGTWKVKWGDINRLQRVFDDGKKEYIFNDSIPSIPVAGTPSWTGSIFTFWTRPINNEKIRYGIGGNSYVSIIEFGSKIKAKSIHYFGSSGSPKSQHYFDQAKLYANGNYKQAYVTLEDVIKNSVNSYKPSQTSKHNN